MWCFDIVQVCAFCLPSPSFYINGHQHYVISTFCAEPVFQELCITSGSTNSVQGDGVFRKRVKSMVLAVRRCFVTANNWSTFSSLLRYYTTTIWKVVIGWRQRLNLTYQTKVLVEVQIILIILTTWSPAKQVAFTISKITTPSNTRPPKWCFFHWHHSIS